MSQLIFRDATRADIPVVLELCRAGAATPNRYPPLDIGDPGYLKAFQQINADPSHRLIVAEANGEVVGTLQISLTPGLPDAGRLRGTLENVHVRADERGKGLGKQMIAWAVERCREANCHMVQLTSNKVRTDAHRFYKSLGFENTHEGFKLKL
jgi:GNAT superfamily N-acetyltransferase